MWCRPKPRRDIRRSIATFVASKAGNRVSQTPLTVPQIQAYGFAATNYATDGLPVVLSIGRRTPIKNVLQETPMDALHQSTGVPFRHFSVSSLTGSVTAGRVGTGPAQML